MLIPCWLAATAFAQEAGNFVPYTTTFVDRLQSFVGIFVFLGICWAVSENRKAIKWRPVVWGLIGQVVIALIILSPTLSQLFYSWVDQGISRLIAFSNDGATFVFGTFQPHDAVVGAPADIAAGNGTHQLVGGGQMGPEMKNFAFLILPTIIFFSTLMAVLYHIGLMPLVVRWLAVLMMRTTGISGAESLSTAANIFVGQTEAPLLVKPFIPDMTRSELMTIMVGGFANTAGGVLGAYVAFLAGLPNIAGHLVICSFLSAPATIACAKIVVPETEQPKTAGEMAIAFDKTATNLVEAAAQGASDGVRLAINVGGMLIAFVALVHMVDWFVSFAPLTHCGGGWTAGYHCATGAGEPLSMSQIFGVLFAPLALAMGVPFQDALTVGQLLGEKLVLTEFIAYSTLGGMVHGATPVLTERSALLAAYGLCGFANFASVGIQLGGLGGMAPKRMADLASLGFKAMWAGMLATCMTAAVAGLFL